MWEWTCDACPGLRFEGATRAKAQAKFFEHVRIVHPRATVLSLSEDEDDL